MTLTPWPEQHDIEAAWGPPVGKRVRTITLDGVQVVLEFQEREHDGLRVVVAAEAAGVELHAAEALVNLGHSGPEGLRFMRKAVGVSILELSETLGLSEKIVRCLEAGEVQANIAVVATYHRLVVDASARGALPELRFQ